MKCSEIKELRLLLWTMIVKPTLKWYGTHGESLELTAKRTLPYFSSKILPQLDAGKNIFVAAHGNSLRSVIMDIEGLSREEVLRLEVPTGTPIVYERLEGKWKRINNF